MWLWSDARFHVEKVILYELVRNKGGNREQHLTLSREIAVEFWKTFADDMLPGLLHQNNGSDAFLYIVLDVLEGRSPADGADIPSDLVQKVLAWRACRLLASPQTEASTERLDEMD